MNRIISPHFPAMPAFPFSRACFAVLAASAAAMSGCSSVDSLSRGITDSITPYRVEVVQGNFVSREQVEALRTGMTRQQVREVLGSPLLTSVFHADRWDYVFILKRQGVEPQARKLAVYFKGDALQRFEGDAMPTDAEFVARLDDRRKTGKVPVLEASEESLKAFAEKSPPVAASATTVAPAPLPPTYPPLESRSR